jgi:hypothetical protein
MELALGRRPAVLKVRELIANVLAFHLHFALLDPENLVASERLF